VIVPVHAGLIAPVQVEERCVAIAHKAGSRWPHAQV
jgi:hypothetical protein